MQSSRQVKVESQQDSTFELGHGPCQQDSGESIQNRQNGSQLVGQYRILQPGTPIRYCRQAKSFYNTRPSLTIQARQVQLFSVLIHYHYLSLVEICRNQILEHNM
ncbi:hypothetical protein SS50377_28597 [Spironucleus salmonicida]|uniref:Uncharacterized protein n=1 Tax=Spironucleus salmonicida TaxID=348837 RepID=A0A9P8LKG7_9EUKA|nr:hypothetical protein SS50377_28597 [Spironucleus salmonicida]